MEGALSVADVEEIGPDCHPSLTPRGEGCRGE